MEMAPKSIAAVAFERVTLNCCGRVGILEDITVVYVRLFLIHNPSTLLPRSPARQCPPAPPPLMCACWTSSHGVPPGPRCGVAAAHQAQQEAGWDAATRPPGSPPGSPLASDLEGKRGRKTELVEHGTRWSVGHVRCRLRAASARSASTPHAALAPCPPPQPALAAQSCHGLSACRQLPSGSQSEPCPAWLKRRDTHAQVAPPPAAR